MAQRQFRSNDTSSWGDNYGSGVNGAYSPSTGTNSPINASCTGTSGTTTLSATNVSFSSPQCVIIHQTRGTGAGTWELNRIAAYSSGTITLAYALTATYSSGAQVQVIPQYTTASIAGGVTLSGNAWNGTTGGIYAIMASTSVTIVGTLSLSGIGYRGGATTAPSGSALTGNQGESEVSGGSRSTAANGTGAGGSSYSSGNGASAGDAGHANAGTAGRSASLSGTPGAAGGIGGDSADLTVAYLGGGGGGGGIKGDNIAVGGSGGSGGGLCLIIARTISVSGSIAANGANGTTGGVNVTTGGGGGSGGSVLLKGQNITLGTSLLTVAGGSEGADMNGVNPNQTASLGRIHADYAATISGTTTPSIDTRQDTTLFDTSGGAFLYNFI